MPQSISPQMRVTSAAIDGQPVEFFAPESLRSNLLHSGDNQAVLLVASEPLDSSRPHEIEVRHAGKVISKAGDKVFFVNARGTWYPRVGTEFSRYDLTFRYPKSLVLVATGEPVEERVEGDWRISRRKSSSSIPYAGFNLGDFERTVVTQGPYRIEVCANKNLEAALRKRAMADGDDPALEHRRPTIVPPPLSTHIGEQRDPSSRIDDVARHVAAALEFMTAAFGPPPIQHLTISPIPGTFGRAWRAS